jgi:hypothetical protein
MGFSAGFKQELFKKGHPDRLHSPDVPVHRFRTASPALAPVDRESGFCQISFDGQVAGTRAACPYVQV